MTNPNTSPVSRKGTRLWLPAFPDEGVYKMWKPLSHREKDVLRGLTFKLRSLYARSAFSQILADERMQDFVHDPSVMAFASSTLPI